MFWMPTSCRASTSTLPVVVWTTASSAIDAVVLLITTLTPAAPATAVLSFSPFCVEPLPASARALNWFFLSGRVPASTLSEAAVIMPLPT